MRIRRPLSKPGARLEMEGRVELKKHERKGEGSNMSGCAW